MPCFITWFTPSVGQTCTKFSLSHLSFLHIRETLDVTEWILSFEIVTYPLFILQYMKFSIFINLGYWDFKQWILHKWGLVFNLSISYLQLFLLGVIKNFIVGSLNHNQLSSVWSLCVLVSLLCHSYRRKIWLLYFTICMCISPFFN